MKRMLGMSVLAVSLTACSTYRVDDYRPEPAALTAALPSRAERILESTRPAQVDDSTAIDDLPAVAGPLSLRQALALTALHHPALAGIAYAQRAAEAEVLQAGRLPNPELELEIEEIGEDEGFDAAVYSLRLGQVLELGGKRGARRARAASAARLAGRDTEVEKVAIYTQTTMAFIDLLEAQAAAAIAHEAATIAEELESAATARLESGAATELESLRARARRAEARVEASAAERLVASRRSQLASMWGAETAGFESAVGAYENLTAALPLERILAAVDEAPAVARWADEMAERLAALRLERAASIPDLALAAGVERAAGEDETAFLVGLGLELPVFDRHRGAIQAARYRALQAEQEQAAARLETRSALIGLWHAWMAARERATILTEEALPSLQAAKTASEAAFTNGKVGYLDVLSAQEDYLAGKQTLAAARAEVHRSQAALEGMLARPLADLIPAASGDQP